MIELVTEKDIKSEARHTVETYYKGFRILSTQPFENGQAIVAFLDKMVAAGFTPQPTDRLPAPTNENKEPIKAKKNESHICPIHDVEMKKWEKDNKVWYSHKVDGGWCTRKKK